MTDLTDTAPHTDFTAALSSAEEIIEEARNGRMFILVDAEDRENEGDLVIPAQMATPDAITFMATHGRGLICLALSEARTQALNLSPMARRNTQRNSTAFTVSIEAREGVTTGISAQDRARTIQVAIDPKSGPEDIASPGHVFPLTARTGGVLARAGHTEAAVDIAELAGLNPAGVICEIMKDDGTMARMPDLVSFAQKHALKIGTIADLIAHRLRTERFVTRVHEQPFDSRVGPGWRLTVFRNSLDGAEHAALVRGDIQQDKPTRVRMHRVSMLHDIIGAGSGHVEEMMRKIQDHPDGGVMVFLRDPNPNAITQALEPPSTDSEKAFRAYGVGAQILLDLGVRDMILLSGSERRLAALEGYGLRIIDREGV